MSAPPTSFTALLQDPTTVTSLASTVAILLAALALSRRVLDPVSTPPRLRALFVWHAFDALIHFILEGGFVYHCLFSSAPVAALKQRQAGKAYYWPDPENFLGSGLGPGVVAHGSQAAVDESPLAKLWMVYAKADRRWGGIDLVRYFCSGLLDLEYLSVCDGERTWLILETVATHADRSQP
jgi:hypothetical protein